MSCTLALHTPSGPDALVSADFVSEADDGTTRTTVWQADEFSSSMHFIAITGDFAQVSVPDSNPPFFVAHLANSTEWVTDMVGWMGRIVPFLDEMAGMIFPFNQVNVVKLPWIEGFPGTATHSMVYLSEVYGIRTAEEFEEMLAHETSHLWWGVLVNPVDNSLWLIEGPAVFSQYDYTAAVHYPHRDRDEYLAERYHWNTLLLRYLTDPESIPPLVLPPGVEAPDTVNTHTTWAYFKSSATLDYLRVVIGAEAFAAGLQSFTATCRLTSCTTQDFRSAMETASGEDLEQFFTQWVYETNYPVVTVGFTGDQQIEVTLDQPYIDLALTHLPLVLQANLADGSTQSLQVLLEKQNDSFTFQLPSEPVSIRPNPRQDTIVWSRSAVEGDVNFDMEVDGLDLIHCAFRDGLAPVTSANPSIYDVEMNFDPRCDFNDDEVIDDTDLDVVNNTFGTLRSP
jgi:aminopeptidase N